MNGINKVIILGHLGQNPEIKKVGNISIANFSVATSERYKDKTTDEIKQITEWHKVVLFNKLADIAGAYLVKGTAIYVEGKLKTEKYTDKDGIERWTTKIIGNNLQILGAKEKPGASDRKTDTPTSEGEQFDDDIPF